MKRNAVLQPQRDSVHHSAHAAEESYLVSDFTQTLLRSSASLFLQQLDRTYRLEIVLKHDQDQIRHTFHLEHRNEVATRPDQKSVHVQYQGTENPTPDSRNQPDLSTRRDYGTALRWLKDCKCYSSGPRSFYPARLINLGNLKAINATYGDSSTGDNNQAIVNIVETRSWSGSGGAEAGYNGGNKEYVTLSHCWGGIVSHWLTRDNYDEYALGIPVQDLPKTFRDAVHFAASMEGVGYLWIDSLCIIQNDAQDWLLQSATMDRVYSETYLNLSATASSNSHGGLFKYGDFKLLEDEEVWLHIEGLPLAYDRKSVPMCLHDRERHFLRRCIIKDASFWENEVNGGPVNSRGWVLQERLMSPRVLHFCHDQVGWECACSNPECDNVTGRQHLMGTANHRSRYDSIIESIRQKFPNASNGAKIDAPVPYTPLHLWAAIVNAYSKTAISHSQDKLVALSGIAKVVAEETRCAYIAGLWRTDLTNQLLWYIEPVFHPPNRSFSNPATSPDKHPERAPTFSWAAIDVTGHGITYAQATQRDFYVRIEETSVQTLTENEFGVVCKARVFLRGKLCEARLLSMPNNRFGWHTVRRAELDSEVHRNVYLDCPQRDLECIDNPNARIYVLPVAKERTDSGTLLNEYLYCLMLRSGREEGTFKRIGMTKLSSYGDRKAMERVHVSGKAGYKIFETLSSNATSSHASNYDQDNGMHRICLI